MTYEAPGATATNILTEFETNSAAVQLLRGSVTFVAGTTGAIAQHTVFTITGMVAFGFYGRCTDPLTSGGAATISYGTGGLVTSLLAASTATDIDLEDSFSPSASAIAEAAAIQPNYSLLYFYSSGADIIADIAAFTITGGTMEYYIFWQPISVGATVTLGAELTAL